MEKSLKILQIIFIFGFVLLMVPNLGLIEKDRLRMNDRDILPKKRFKIDPSNPTTEFNCMNIATTKAIYNNSLTIECNCTYTEENNVINSDETSLYSHKLNDFRINSNKQNTNDSYGQLIDPRVTPSEGNTLTSFMFRITYVNAENTSLKGILELRSIEIGTDKK